jgi:hypothetical protein
MGYRPITDVWLLARPKVKFYGAYPNGFLERARTLLGCSYDDPILHVCGGKARDYPNHGFGLNDRTLDINPDLNPDICMDVTKGSIPKPNDYDWEAILIDPPYTERDASEYGKFPFPEPNALLKKCVDAIPIGRCVGMLHYVIPSVPSNCKEVALIGVIMGNNNRIRCFSIFRKVKE